MRNENLGVVFMTAGFGGFVLLLAEGAQPTLHHRNAGLTAAFVLSLALVAGGCYVFMASAREKKRLMGKLSKFMLQAGLLMDDCHSSSDMQVLEDRAQAWASEVGLWLTEHLPRHAPIFKTNPVEASSHQFPQLHPRAEYAINFLMARNHQLTKIMMAITK